MTDDRRQRVKQILFDASQLKPADRANFLAESCAGDDTLRREVELLLAHHSSATIIPVVEPKADAREPKSRTSKSKSRLSRGATAWSRIVNQWAKQLGLAGQLALGAGVTLVLVFALAWWSQHYVRKSSQNYWRQGFESMLRTTEQHLETWFESERRKVDAWSVHPEFRKALGDLVKPAVPNQAGLGDPAAAADLLRSILDRLNLDQPLPADAVVVVWDRSGKALALKSPTAFALRVVPMGAAIERAAEGKSTLLLPHQCEALTGGDFFGVGQPLMGVVAPIRDSTGGFSGTLFIGSTAMIDEFSKRLNAIAVLDSGEVYAFDAAGRMLSESKFPDQLRRAGVLEAERTSSVFMPLRDPGGDLTRGYQSEIPYVANDRTHAVNMAAEAKQDGVNVEGYRDYRGVPVIGGWHWVDGHDFGVVIEIDLDEAYDQVEYLNWFFYARVVLMVVVLALLLWSWRSTVKMRRRVADAPRIGPYMLDVQIGEGGMGRVYRANHALLKRPTAVKIIKPDLVTEQTLSWFEREVTLAGRLTHPNTIEIYDFGRTDEGQFYCAMEYLRGLTLSQVLLIDNNLPPARVIHILKQIAASLAEAHDVGLVHRDVKLHNVMLCLLGGEADHVKVLDFGLAKQAERRDGNTTFSAQNLVGTPLYMAPERLKAPYAADARSDVYSVGMAAYKLLTGRDMFSAESDLELFNHAVNTPPRPPSAIARNPIPAELDELVLRAAAKNPDDRPANGRALVEALELLAEKHPWHQADSMRWWVDNRDRIHELSPQWSIAEVLSKISWADSLKTGSFARQAV